MDVTSIIREYLIKNGYDGLHNGAECGCDVNDLFPCDGMGADCNPGHKVIPPKDAEYEFYICENKTDEPWEI